MEILESVLARAEDVQPRLYPFVTIDAEAARTAARAAEQAVMRTGSRWARCTASPFRSKTWSRPRPAHHLRLEILRDNVPTFDSVVVERVRAAGGIIFGKTNTPDFGHKDSCDNLLMPPTRNPWKLDRTSGASSGGAAVAVAVGAGPVGAWHRRRRLDPHPRGVVRRVRPQAVLRAGAVLAQRRHLGRPQSHSGPLTRTVRDAGLLLGVHGRA